MIQHRIGKQISRRRNALGITQEELAERAEITSSYLGKLERGEQCGSIRTYEKISRALGSELQVIVGGDQQSEVDQIPGGRLLVENVPLLDDYYQQKLEKHIEQIVTEYLDFQKRNKKQTTM